MLLILIFYGGFIMKKLRMAIIGQGRSGRGIHGKFLKSEANEFFDVVAVVDFDESARKLALEEYPGCVALADYKELFDRDDIDLVTNASYSHLHYSTTKDLLEHGFNVIVEKPMARNYYECCDLINTAKKNNVTLAVFQQTFLAPYYLEALKFAKSGKLGEIKQVNVRFNGLGRRWDWQTLQAKLGGCVYNTGPHPIGIALGFLNHDENTKVEFSKLGLGLASGDAEDYAKIVLTAPGKPVVDVEISALDAFCDYNIKIQGTKGTFVGKIREFKAKYIVDGENVDRPFIVETLRNENGAPAYCGETLITHEESGPYAGTAFDVAVHDFYQMVYENLTEGKPLTVKPEYAAKIINIIETVHAQNPMPLLYQFD